MKISDQVCTMEQAKRLHELGIMQKSIFHHVFRHLPRAFWNVEILGTAPESWQSPQDQYSAFTVAELGVIHDCFSVTPGHFENKGKFGFPSGKVKGENDFYPTEAQARAQWLIIALEKGWTTAKEVNQRLQSV